MPPALALRRALTRSRGFHAQTTPPSICLFCSFSPSRSASSSPTALLRSTRKPLASLPRIQQQQTHQQRRHQFTSTAPSPSPSNNPRVDLHRALTDLQSHLPNHTHPARLQLALRNLSEPPGHESIRVAILGLPTSGSTNTAKRLLRLALADPLRPAAAWEARLEAHDAAVRPLVVRIGKGDAGQELSIGDKEQQRHVIPELTVDTPLLRGAELEMLVAEASLGVTSAVEKEAGAVDDAVLVPTVDVAATTAGHVAPVGTPVHMALLVGDGVVGAASILALPLVEGRDVIAGAVNFAKVGREDLADCPVVGVNVDAASEGLALFRADVGNAMQYEALWSEANIGPISEWLKKGALSSENGAMKTPVRNLITSLLRNARAAVQEEEAQDLTAELHTKVLTDAVAHLDQALAEWAQSAHQELQQQLDVAFSTRPWSKLGWWKLFWRADDVGLVTSEMVALRFLPGAEKSMIYLAGRIQEAGAVEGQQGQPLYSGPALPQPSTGTARQDFGPSTVSKWPTHIPFTRNYLQEKTVPALQALAQKLVVQSASLAGLSTALAGLSYLSALGVYECGAIAALGIALSFKRFQQKWDAAREYWEGEVREEGRKAIRATEASIAEVLDKAGRTPDPQADRGAELEALRNVEEIIERAEKALARIK